ncbi:hypothetical protein [Actinopolymorpha alba]|nr:hypothetical protein [Actinopolymorpha alba]
MDAAMLVEPATRTAPFHVTEVWPHRVDTADIELDPTICSLAWNRS